MGRPFAFVDINPGRSVAKPRNAGLTMIADMGLPLASLEAILEISGDYIDLAKFFAGSARLYDDDYLRSKLNLYCTHSVRAFTGGAFLEQILRTNGMRASSLFFDELVRLGFDAVEISDQTTVLAPDQRTRLIQAARERGLAVFAEVGSKAASVEQERLIEQVQTALDAGAELVTIEAAELFRDGDANMPLIDELRHRLNLDKVLFEIAGPAVAGMTLAKAHGLKRLLIRTLGPDVNLGNIRPDDIFDTEVRRLGVGPSGQLLAGDQQASVTE